MYTSTGILELLKRETEEKGLDYTSTITQTYKKTISVVVYLKEEETEKREVLNLPADFKTIQVFLSRIKGKKFYINQIKSNCNLKLMLEEDYDLYTEIIRLQSKLEKLNILSNFTEVQALIEYVSDDIDKLLDIIVEGKYHFYPNINLNYVSEELVSSYEIGSLNYLKEMASIGYYQTSTGVIYVPKEINSELLKKK